MIRALGKHKARLARLGVALELEVLPVVHAEIAPRLDALATTLEPDAILHFGLAGRRKTFSIETRALNRTSLLHPDAAGARAASREIVAGGPLVAKSTFPAPLVAAALRRAGIHAELSANAGDYICNQALYLSLATAKARSIGFIHVPRLARRESAARARRPSFEEAMRVAVIAILVMAAKLRAASKRAAALGPTLDPEALPA